MRVRHRPRSDDAGGQLLRNLEQQVATLTQAITDLQTAANAVVAQFSNQAATDQQNADTIEAVATQLNSLIAPPPVTAVDGAVTS